MNKEQLAAIGKIKLTHYSTMLSTLVARCQEQIQKDEPVHSHLRLNLYNGGSIEGIPCRIGSFNNEEHVFLVESKPGDVRFNLSVVPLRQIVSFTIYDAQSTMSSMSQGEIAFDHPVEKLSQLDAKRRIFSMLENLNSIWTGAVDLSWEQIETDEDRTNLIKIMDGMTEAFRQIGKDNIGNQALAGLERMVILQGRGDFFSCRRQGSDLNVELNLKRAVPNNFMEYLIIEISKII